MAEVQVGSGRIDTVLNPKRPVFLELARQLLRSDQSGAPLFKLPNYIFHRLHRESEMLAEPARITRY
jgi:hypothetical protein